MSKTRIFTSVALAFSLATVSSQSPKTLGESDLFRNIEPPSGDSLNGNSSLLPKDKPPVPKEKSPNTTEITADNAEFNNKTHIAIFNGKVIVVNPDFNVTCDKLTAYLKHDDKPAVKPTPAVGAGTPADPKPKPASDATPAAPSKGGLERAHAEMTNGGRVVITQDKKETDGTMTNSTGTAEQADYNATTGDIKLTGNPEIRQGISHVVPAEEGVILILNRDGRYRAIGRTKTLLQDKEKEKDKTPKP